MNGTHRQQFTFSIKDTQCTPIVVDDYPMHPGGAMDRCYDRMGLPTQSPTSQPTSMKISMGFPNGVGRDEQEAQSLQEEIDLYGGG
jgi:hypothetical protein